MKKKLLSLALALVLCLGLAVPAFAAETMTETLDGITLTANPNGTLSYTGTGEFYADYLYMGLDYLLYATEDMTTASSLSISISSGISMEESVAEEMKAIVEELNAAGYPITLNDSSTHVAAPAPAPKPEKPAPAPAPAEETYELDGITITAKPDGTLSYTGAGEMWMNHVGIGMELLLVVTDYMDGISTVPVSIAPGITYGDDIAEMGGINAAFKEIADAFGLEATFNVNTASAPSTPAQPAQTSGVNANPNSSTVLVNGENVAFDAYTIDGNNYFKLRDLAYVLSGTGKQFEVSWDGAANAISLTSGKGYTAVGGEMSAKGTGSQTAKPTTSKILLDGKEVSLTAYNINNNNYFKLRDIGSAFNFGVDWDNTSKTISIDTSKGYTPEN